MIYTSDFLRKTHSDTIRMHAWAAPSRPSRTQAVPRTGASSTCCLSIRIFILCGSTVTGSVRQTGSTARDMICR